MASFIRVKRRYNEEPSNVLLIACKKSKIIENEGVENAYNDEPVTAVVKFAGTVKDQDEDAIKRLAKTVRKNELKENFKKHMVDIKNMLRTQIKNNSIQSRYKIVNRHRSMDESNIEESGDNLTVIDIEETLSYSIPVEKDSETIDNFVYDLYYTEHGMITIDDDVVYMQGVEEELVYDLEENDEPEYSSDDSNSESRWNDYPDSDQEENGEDEDEEDFLSTGIKRCTLNDDYQDAELDSDSSIDDFIYSVDKNDVKYFGYKYARYKARTNKNLAMGNYSHNNELEFDFEGIDESISNDEYNNDSSSCDSSDHDNDY
ncbi:PREDICTED: probable RNA polymerase II nuclear localization protein SLC7A6OS [Polistes canadensis]|uniref:probable RNA polymerase II nuclear localization protein SLC7A6OS n=1 Tax=Polistes canadensis TaxID=91411 RepID=UPI000718B9F4|nr:PREDICTED: probable RNA polymerase II nuclear localization protein SLC7A6OS [Polistes canadensis]